MQSWLTSGGVLSMPTPRRSSNHPGSPSVDDPLSGTRECRSKRPNGRQGELSHRGRRRDNRFGPQGKMVQKERSEQWNLLDFLDDEAAGMPAQFRIILGAGI